MKRLHNHPILKKYRKSLRNRSTRAEVALWKLIKKRQLKGRKFRRQYSIGRYIIDFYCYEESLAVEVDGPIHETSFQMAYDAERTAFLEGHGVTVIRVQNEEVFREPDTVLRYISSHFRGCDPSAPKGHLP